MESHSHLINGVDIVHIVKRGRARRVASAPLRLALYRTAEAYAANSIGADALVNSVWSMRPDVRDARCGEKPEDCKTTPHQAERDHQPILLVKDDGRIRPAGPLYCFSRQQLGRKHFEGYGRGHLAVRRP